MKTVILAAALAATAFPALATHKTHHHHHKHTHQAVAEERVIVVSCFRGPWEDVIWDRPKPVFVDSLVEYGYDINTATSIAEKICSDEELVGNSEGLKAEMRRVYRSIRP